MTNTDLSTKELFQNTVTFPTSCSNHMPVCNWIFPPLLVEVLCNNLFFWGQLPKLLHVLDSFAKPTKYELISDRCLFLLCKNKVILREKELGRRSSQVETLHQFGRWNEYQPSRQCWRLWFGPYFTQNWVPKSCGDSALLYYSHDCKSEYETRIFVIQGGPINTKCQHVLINTG